MSEVQSLLEEARKKQVEGMEKLFEDSKTGFLNQIYNAPFDKAILQYPNQELRNLMAEKFKQEGIEIFISTDENENRTIEKAYGFWASIPK